MIEGVSRDQEGRDAASIQWFTGERGALPAELLAQLRGRLPVPTASSWLPKKVNKNLDTLLPKEHDPCESGVGWSVD